VKKVDFWVIQAICWYETKQNFALPVYEQEMMLIYFVGVFSASGDSGCSKLIKGVGVAVIQVQMRMSPGNQFAK
jgi:hypothetical protein